MLLLFGALFLTGISGRVQYSSFDNLDGIQVGSKFFYFNAAAGEAAFPQDFNGAKDECERLGGKLAIPQNAEEDEAISAYIEEHFLGDASQIRDYAGAWIGIYMLRNGTFMDVDGNQASYVPLDFHSRLVADFDICLSVTQGFYFSSAEQSYTEAVMWDESFCGRAKMPLCEQDLTETCKISTDAAHNNYELLSLLPHDESCEGSTRCFNGTLIEDTCAFPNLYSVNETACIDPREVPECDVDECADPDACPANSINCINEVGTYSCECDAGFEFQDFGWTWNTSAWECADIDECVEQLDECTGRSFCDNYDGGYDCICHVGFYYENFTHGECVDYDECHDGIFYDRNVWPAILIGDSQDVMNTSAMADLWEMIPACPSFSSCANQLGTYNCTCDDGYDLMIDNNTDYGFFCADVDECATGDHMCDENAFCDNITPGYNCTCMIGYFGDGWNCTDVDECAEEIDMCDDNASCSNFDGGYNCTCEVGWEGEGFNCTDVDECLEEEALRQIGAFDDCDINSSCNNLPGSYNCTCDEGFFGDGLNCTDIDECAEETHVCDDVAVCGNFEGGYNCTCMAPEWEGDGFNCTDVDECADEIDMCDDNADCSNFDGGYNCTCDFGWEGDGWNCTDVDECADEIHMCDDVAVCSNFDGGYNCTCMVGWEGDGFNCTDVDECADEDMLRQIGAFDDCDVNSACNNLPGSYNCTCMDGYSGDGFECEDIDECSDEALNECHEMAYCMNFDGGYNCTCMEGYFDFSNVTGTQCEDIDECGLGLDACHDQATCENTVGDYTCECNDGFYGDGFCCKDSNECAVSDYFGGAATTTVAPVNETASENCQFSPMTLPCPAGFDDFNGRCYKMLVSLRDYYSHVARCQELAEENFSEHGYVASFTGDAPIAEQFDFLASLAGDKSPWIGFYTYQNQFTNLFGDVLSGDFWAPNFPKADGSCVHWTIVGSLKNRDCSSERATICMIDYPQALPVDTQVPTHNCSVNAACANAFGTYECHCDEGYDGDGFTCEDVDECALEIDECGPANVGCENFEGGYNCTCEDGFRGDGFDPTFLAGRIAYTGCEDIDECAEEIDECHELAFCGNFAGGYNCTCPLGYEGDGFNCTDVDECREEDMLRMVGAFDDCDDNSHCHNFAGGYNCSCNDGFQGDGFFCEDIDECAEEDTCHDHASCDNFAGGFNCTCVDGFQGDGFNCTDIDECEAGTDECVDFSVCDNFEGGYNCTCEEGLKGDAFVECVDINECANGDNTCSDNANCTNTFQSYTCDCLPGFHDSGYCPRGSSDGSEDAFFSAIEHENCISLFPSLRNFDEATNLCANEGGELLTFEQTSVNDIAMFNAWVFNIAAGLPAWIGYSSPAGNDATQMSNIYTNEPIASTFNLAPKQPNVFEEACFHMTAIGQWKQSACTKFKPTLCMFQQGPAGEVCEDIDECAEGVCADNAICENLIGSFTCNCPDGFSGDGFTCEDVDECADPSLNDCPANSDCSNFDGGYECVCVDGYEMAADEDFCVDINECDDTTVCADPNSSCTNSIGSFSCDCNHGFVDSSHVCVDVDECVPDCHVDCTEANCDVICIGGDHMCFADATCSNFEGGYECLCADGFEGDGLTTGNNCTDVNECLDDTICEDKSNSACVNSVGSYDCECLPGFLPLGTECPDFNECLIPGAHDNCDPVNGICSNTIGSYECSCPEFFTGTGTVDDPCLSELGECLFDDVNVENAVMSDCSTITEEFQSCSGVECAPGMYLTFDGKDAMNIVSECTCEAHVNCTHVLNKNVACVDCPDNDVITWFGFSTNDIKVSGPTGGLIQSRVEANFDVTADWSAYTVLLVFPGDLTDARIFTWVFDVAQVKLEADGSSTMVVLSQNANSPTLSDTWSDFFVGLDNVASLADSGDLTTFKVGVMPGSIVDPDCVLDTNAPMPSESPSRMKQRKERKHARKLADKQ